MIETLGQAFPALAALVNDVEGRDALEHPFALEDRTSVYMAFALFGTVASDHSTRVDALVDCAEAMLDRLPDLAKPGMPANDILTFGISTLTAEALQHRGEPVGPAVFLHRAIAADEG